MEKRRSISDLFRILLTAFLTVLLIACTSYAGETAGADSEETGGGSSVIESVVINTEVEIGGQRVHSIEMSLAPGVRYDDLLPADFSMTGRATNWNDPTLRGFSAEISRIEWNDSGLILHFDTFPIKFFFVKTFEVSCQAHPELSFTEADVTKVVTPVADEFEDGYFEGTDYLYHLFTPKANRDDKAGKQAFPIIVVFHGYGDTDNILTYRTSVEWAEEEEQALRPCYVLSPQIFNYLSSKVRIEVYEAVHAKIEELIAAGEVDANRIYVMGNSFGGAATIEFIEKYPDFVATGIPLCPALNYVEAAAYKNLSEITQIPLWFAHADSDRTIDSSVSKTAYEILEKTGAVKNHITIYSDEEMIAAGGDPNPDATLSFHHVEIAVMPDKAYHEWLFEQTR